ncbi:peptidase M23 [Anaerobacillus alkalidiazotrophicus]|uniref:Peptidase M23 n=1 Tax=Anaerobacillus alkalidiazotrophicus TaxID=472963 RepID=A0A1S2M212_9BACI|nr:peptidoglycan DD-metalloendopeptidase family protein [Anaerobacillus alkalidiazotrophicus]OIJ17695.1 peptidase M23 [Anaerobacillus alkalidiazotrophicus]
MKRSFILFGIFMLLLIISCNTNKEEEPGSHEGSLDQITNETLKELQLKRIGENTVFHVYDLFEVVEGEFNFDELHRSLTMKLNDQTYKLVDGIPVVEQNGIYLPTDEIFIVMDNEKVYLPKAFLDIVLGLEVDVNDNKVVFQWTGETLPTSSIQTTSLVDEEWDVDKMVDYLSFLKKPIQKAEVSTIPNHLPGAKRAYRNGHHEGIDWYGYATGQHISFDTAVLAMAEGVVVRVDHDYEEYTTAQVRNKDLSLTAELGETPQYIFDRLRGRQVWIQYEKGVMNRFAHLDAIPETLHVGDVVNSETIIGYVGNSGTSGAVNGDGSELHLHQDLLIYGELFWKPFTLDEVKEILIRVFND